MSSFSYTGTFISSSYHFVSTQSSIRRKITELTNIPVSSALNNLVISVPRVRPIWCCFLGDLINGKDMDTYVACADFSQFQKYISSFPASAFPSLLKDQAYDITVSHGEVNISVETTIRVDQATKPLRTKVPHTSPLAASFVADFLRFVLVKFVPLAISNFCATVFKYKVRTEDLSDQDVRFSDYFILNNEFQLLKKNQFMELSTPLDFLYAATFNPNASTPTFTPSALLTMYATSSASILGVQSDSILGPNDYVGSAVLDVTRGAVTKRLITSRGVFVKLFTSYTIRTQDNDLLAGLLTSASSSSSIIHEKPIPAVVKTTPRPSPSLWVEENSD